MQRRNFLLLSAGVTSLAGCSGENPTAETETAADVSATVAGTTDSPADVAAESETAVDEETNLDSGELPDGFSETGIEDTERVQEQVRTALTEESFEFTFEPILTAYTRRMQMQGSSAGELHGTLLNQQPGAPRDELRETELYVPPESSTAYARVSGADKPEYIESTRGEFVRGILDVLIQELDYFSYSYSSQETFEGTEAYIFDITGPADEEQWENVNFGTGVSYDEFNSGRTVVDRNGMVLDHSYEVTDTETGETAEPDWNYRTVDEVQISRPDWVDEV